MPRIPTYTSQTSGLNVPQSVDVIPTYPIPGGAVAAPLEQLSSTLAQIGGRLGRQQDESEYLNFKNQYDAGEAAIRLDLDYTPETQDNPGAYGRLYQERTQALQEQIVGNGKSTNGARYFRSYLNGRTGEDNVKATAHGLKLFSAGQVARFNIEEDQMARAAVTPDMERQGEILADHAARVDSMVRAGLMTNAEGMKRVAEFRPKVQENTMQGLARANPSLLREMNNNNAFYDVSPEKRAYYLEQANIASYTDDARAAKEMGERAKIYEQDLTAMAANPAVRGELSDTIIDNGIAGLDPLLPDPKAWIAIKKLKENPPTSEGNKQVKQIASDFAHAAQTVETADKALEALDKLREELGAPNDAATKLAEHVNGVRRSLMSTEAAVESRARAVRGEQRAVEREGRAEGVYPGIIAAQQRAAKNAEVGRALSSYNAQLPPLSGFSMLDKQEKAQRERETAEIRNMILNRGVSETDAVSTVLGRRKAPTRTPPPGSPGSAPSKSATDEEGNVQQILKGIR